MEQKTIGSFIAALRKANGMTQKDLAEKLNVSDKTISRWERDDGTPDLSVIPVIAEIFGVTCDELLRGERYSPAERIRENDGNKLTAKGEKQRQRLWKSTLLRYRAQTYIAIGISIVTILLPSVKNGSRTTSMTILSFMEVRNNGSDAIEAEREKQKIKNSKGTDKMGK